MLYSISSIDVAILCGGLGSRLREEIGENQKVMAKVGNQPLLDRILNHLVKQGIKRVILLTGYKADFLEEYYSSHDFDLEIAFSREQEPLGTGGALKHARDLIHSDPFICVNGDSFCALGYQGFVDFYHRQKAIGVLAVSPVENRDDFGTILLDESRRIISFMEKQKSPSVTSCLPPRLARSVFVNAGVYCFARKVFDRMPKKEKFSLEMDFFPTLVSEKIFGFVTKEKFWDIGTPKRLQAAQKHLSQRKK